ncbi:hypothetical protein GCM10010466_31050 [Planomonospora alba]|uniref:Hypothetical membrane protein n=1 Tax=Planomonospora alba TaxID=161354 RepID=R4ZCW4_9ACTN|nr:hypothetical membrane protein [Planomonospora alba]
MTTATWWRHEVRRCGRQAFALPVLAALLAYAAVAAGPGAGMLLGRSLMSCALPAATALACAAVVAREPMLELHLSLPTAYPRTVTRRLAWPGAVAAAAALALAASVTLTGRFSDPATVFLEMAGLAVLLSGGAMLATARFASAAPATGLVVAAVLAKLLLLDRVVPAGLAQALPASATGIWLAALALREFGRHGRAGDRLGRGTGPHHGIGEA